MCKIALDVPQNLVSPEALVVIIKTQLHRYLPRVHNLMMQRYSDHENDAAKWLEDLMNLPNQGYDLGVRQQPPPIDIVQIERTDAATAPTEGVPPMYPTTVTNQLAYRLRTQDRCRNCGNRGHWAKDCRIRPRNDVHDSLRTILERRRRRQGYRLHSKGKPRM